MDITDTIQPNSDQLDAAELTSPRTFTISDVSRGSREQPVNLHLAELDGRAWRPSKNVRRQLVAAWGADASKYVGRKARLYCDPTVRYGKQAVGGVRIEALSHIDKPVTTAIIETRGRSKMVTVQPLPTEPVGVDDAVAKFQLETASLEELKNAWPTADPATKKLIEERAAQLKTEGGDAK